MEEIDYEKLVNVTKKLIEAYDGLNCREAITATTASVNFIVKKFAECEDEEDIVRQILIENIMAFSYKMKKRQNNLKKVIEALANAN